MLLPTLNELPTARDLIDVFGGYNHNLRIGSGEFYDMKNLTSDNYPVMSPRKQRGVFVAEGDPKCMVAKDKLCYVSGRTLYIYNKGKKEELDLDEYFPADPPEQLVTFGTYIIILPEGVYVNTRPNEDGEYEVGNVNAYFGSQNISVRLCLEDGTEYDPYPFEDNIPPDDNNRYWLDHGEFGDPLKLKKYSVSTNEWVEVANTFIKLCSPGIGKKFEVGDAVTISNFENSHGEKISGTHVILSKTDDEIVIRGLMHKSESLKSSALIARQIPIMDFMVECENRLWGCRYGETYDGQFVNEIYASALGDFKNWYKFEGISTDSYVASVGTEGKFTGAITHFGYPIFFKENCIHKIYGNYPSNYQIQTTSCRGVQDGCHKSLAVVNEVLYFKARTGVCAYDGSLPVEVSSALGNEAYSNAAAGALGNKYYISMKDAHGGYHMFVLDTAKGLWHREDDTQATEFCNCRGELYYIDYDGKQIKTVLGTGTLDTSAVEWEAITSTIGTDMPDKKYISRLDVRMLLNVGASVFIYAEYDSSGAWELLHSMNGLSLRSFAIPIKPKRCDHLRLKIVGRGDAKIFSICKTIEQGSDV